MAYFPIFIQLEGEDCLVAGGGKVAQRKVEILLEYGYSREEIDALLARKVVGVYAKE